VRAGPPAAPEGGMPERAGAAVEAAGWALLVGGAALLVLPGPGIPLVLAGLVLVGKRRRWARRLHGQMQDRARRALDMARKRRRDRP